MSFCSIIFNKNIQLIRNISKIQTNNNFINTNLLLSPSIVGLTQTRDAFCSVKTKKRRKTYPFRWWTQRDKKLEKKNYLTNDNKEFVESYIKDKYKLSPNESPMKTELIEKSEYTEGSIRCGLIAKKIGVYPMWTKTGKRLLTTALQIVENHVIRYHSPEEFKEMGRPVYQHTSFKDRAVMVVGAQDSDPRRFTASYLGLFNECGTMPKSKLTRFYVTENARLSPGTPLYATHFRAGDYVDIFGKTIDHGFQGVVKRWGFRGQPKHRGVTKAHNRIGSIGRGRKVMGPWKGKKMPGHMGCERRCLPGLKIWRINTKHNVIWVQGPAVPGPTHSWCYMFDTRLPEKKFAPENPPPFPTYYPQTAEELPEDMYDKDVHIFSEPTLIFEETEAERKAALTAAKSAKKAKTAKIR